jgi:uncharacterized damage-inducible protein DinB
MNQIMQYAWPTFTEYQALRNQMMDSLRDEDLSFHLGGENVTLGALCKEMGEVQQAYIDSFRTFTQDFTYRHDEPGLEHSVQRLSAWFERLDGELEAAVSALTDEDLANRVIDRGGGFTVSPRIQLKIYQEALLIFYGKASVYLKAMGVPRTQQWQEWIA